MNYTIMAHALFSMMMVIIMIYDACVMRIPHLLNASVIFIFIFYAIISDMQLHDISYRIAIASIVFMMVFIAAMCGPLGGADVYLSTSIALWLGNPSQIMAFFFVAYVLTCVMTAALLLLHITRLGLVLSALPLPLPRWLADALHPASSPLRSPFPLGVPLAASALLCVWQ